MKITEDSHLDHGLSDEQIQEIATRFADRDAFFIETIEIEGTLPCRLYGPIMGDDPVPDGECAMEARNGRPGPSRLCSRPPRPRSTVTVIAGPHEDEPCILYTAYAGPLAPREPWDSSLDDEGRAESEAFWAQHALARE